MVGNADNKDLQVEVSYRQIIKIALPISFAIFVPQINFITNNIFLGQLGERELGTAGLTGVYYIIFGSIGFGLNNGLQALISRRAGENRVEEIGKLFSQGIRIAMMIAIAAVFITYLITPYILQFALHDPQREAEAMSFLRIRIWGLPFLYVYQMRNALLVGTNQARFLIAGTLAETVVNIILDYTLINGYWGFPRLGFNGAAVASIIAEATGMFVVFIVIHIKGISKRFSLAGGFRYDRVNSNLILQQSSPLIFQHAISIISWIFFYFLIEHHGSRDLAISNTMRNIFGFFGVFTWAFAATSNTMVSNVIGQGKIEQVIPLIHKIVRISLTISIGVALLLNIFPGIFLSIYGQNDQFIRDAIPVVRIVSSALIVMSFAVVWLNAVTGTGNSKINLAIEVVAIVFYCIYNYLVLEYYFLPITWGWASEWLYWLILFSLSFAYIKSGKWKGKIV